MILATPLKFMMMRCYITNISVQSYLNVAVTIEILVCSLPFKCQESAVSKSLVIGIPRCSDIEGSAHFKDHYCVMIGDQYCLKPLVISPFIINCTLPPGTNENLDIVLLRRSSEGGGCGEGVVIAEFPRALLYKQVINFKEKFGKLVEYGVGGMHREIEELYRRAFASRGNINTCTCMHVCTFVYIFLKIN